MPSTSTSIKSSDGVVSEVADTTSVATSHSEAASEDGFATSVATSHSEAVSDKSDDASSELQISESESVVMTSTSTTFSDGAVSEDGHVIQSTSHPSESSSDAAFSEVGLATSVETSDCASEFGLVSVSPSFSESVGGGHKASVSTSNDGSKFLKTERKTRTDSKLATKLSEYLYSTDTEESSPTVQQQMDEGESTDCTCGQRTTLQLSALFDESSIAEHTTLAESSIYSSTQPSLCSSCVEQKNSTSYVGSTLMVDARRYIKPFIMKGENLTIGVTHSNFSMYSESAFHIFI
jgi:hypothetical protein